MAILRNIFHANSSWERRSEYIQSALEHVDALRIYIRLSRDLHVISLTVFVDINTHIELVSRQLTGWDRGSRQRQSTETSMPGIVSR